MAQNVPSEIFRSSLPGRRTFHAVIDQVLAHTPAASSNSQFHTLQLENTQNSVILSAEMMLRYLGWNEAADLIIESINKAMTQGRVTYDLERLMTGATLLKCSEFGDALIDNM